MIFIGKTREIIVGLRFEIGAGNAATRLKQGKSRTLGEGVDKGGDEYGFSSPRQASDAQSQGGVHKPCGKVFQTSRRYAASVGYIS